MRVAASEELLTLALEDDRVVFVGSDLGFGAMEGLRREVPERFFMEGVSEQYVMGMAAGLAMEGFIPFVASIASFITRRCYEQIRIDVCLHDLPVRILGLGGGLVYAPLGPTHTAVEDCGLLREIPNLTVAAPGDKIEVRAFLRESLYRPGPLYLRLGPAGPPPLPTEVPPVLGRGRLLRTAGDVLIVSTGAMTHTALAVSEILASQSTRAGVLHVSTVAPIDEETLLAAADSVELVASLEEHSVVGGLGSAVSEVLTEWRPSNGTPMLRLGLPREFPAGATTRDAVLAAHGLDAVGVARSIADRLSNATRRRAITPLLTAPTKQPSTTRHHEATGKPFVSKES
jgi:transketolase